MFSAFPDFSYFSLKDFFQKPFFLDFFLFLFILKTIFPKKKFFIQTSQSKTSQLNLRSIMKQPEKPLYSWKISRKVLEGFVLIFEPASSRFHLGPVLILHQLKFRTLFHSQQPRNISSRFVAQVNDTTKFLIIFCPFCLISRLQSTFWREFPKILFHSKW